MQGFAGKDLWHLHKGSRWLKCFPLILWRAVKQLLSDFIFLPLIYPTVRMLSDSCTSHLLFVSLQTFHSCVAWNCLSDSPRSSLFSLQLHVSTLLSLLSVSLRAYHDQGLHDLNEEKIYKKEEMWKREAVTLPTQAAEKNQYFGQELKKLTTAKDLTLHLIELIKPTGDMINNIANSKSNFGGHYVTDLPL